MGSKFTEFVLIGGLLAAAGCASGPPAPPRPTLSADQCLSTDWAALGRADGLAGHGLDWMQRHVTACAETGITPDAAAYQAAMVEGQRAYCTPARAFSLAVRGRSYTNGWCAADLEPAFLVAYADGVVVQQSYQNTVTADSRLADARRRLDQIGYDATAAEQRLAVEGITQAEVDSLRARLRNLGNERETVQRSIRELEWGVDESRRLYAETRSRYIPTYGAF